MKRTLEIRLWRKNALRAALRLGKGRDVEYAAAFALALSGDSAGSQRLAADLETRFPEDTPVQFEYLPTCTRFRRSRVGRRWTQSSDCNGRFPMTSHCRARRSSQSSEAAIPPMCAVRRTLPQDVARRPRRNFRKSSITAVSFLADPIGALAHLQLGRAYVVSGDMTKAKKAYQDFLTLWKDADPDIPVLKQASAEYAKL